MPEFCHYGTEIYVPNDNDWMMFKKRALIQGLMMRTVDGYFFNLTKRLKFFYTRLVFLVGVAQLVEHWIVAPVVEGSSPFTHPIFM